MKQKLPYVITISRQLGSGGAYIGQRLAERLGILYMDREILTQAAKKLKVLEEEIEHRDEKRISFWKSLFESAAYLNPDAYTPPPGIYIPTNQELYQAESEIIEKVAQERSSIIIGRGGYYVLRKHPRLLSVFLHADDSFRQKRVEEYSKKSGQEAKKLIEKSDIERGRYLYSLTGHDWNDSRQYNLSIDTGQIGLDDAGELIFSCVKKRFNFVEK